MFMSEFVERREFDTRALHRQRGFTHGSIRPLLVLSDACIIVCASVVGNAAYQFVAADGSDLATYSGIGLFCSVGYLLAAHYFHLYRSQEFVRPRVEFGRIFAAWLVMILLLTVFLFLMKIGSQVSRGSIICFLGISLPSLLLWRRVAKYVISKEMGAGTIRSRRALVIGTTEELFFDHAQLSAHATWY
jgi:undecaprenyl-phosphate glucose phosphotransferase